jgi:hypothetical protein
MVDDDHRSGHNVLIMCRYISNFLPKAIFLQKYSEITQKINESIFLIISITHKLALIPCGIKVGILRRG